MVQGHVSRDSRHAKALRHARRFAPAPAHRRGCRTGQKPWGRRRAASCDKSDGDDNGDRRRTRGTVYTEYGSGKEREGSALPATTCTWKSCHSFAGSRRDCGRQIGQAASASVCAGICCTTAKRIGHAATGMACRNCATGPGL